jgi:hypothetical protein
MTFALIHLNPDHVPGQRVVGFNPRLLDAICELVPERVLENANQCLSHDEEHFGLDTVSDMLEPEVMHDFC